MAAVSSYPQQVETDEAQKAYVVMLDKLKTYQAYPVGWDGEDAVPLTPQVVMNFNHLLEVIDKQLLVGLTIFPETNGTLLIDCTDKEAGISLGNDKFSYYIINASFGTICTINRDNFVK